jgi:hypothetical protein
MVHSQRHVVKEQRPTVRPAATVRFPHPQVIDVAYVQEFYAAPLHKVLPQHGPRTESHWRDGPLGRRTLRTVRRARWASVRSWSALALASTVDGSPPPAPPIQRAPVDPLPGLRLTKWLAAARAPRSTLVPSIPGGFNITSNGWPSRRQEPGGTRSARFASAARPRVGCQRGLAPQCLANSPIASGFSLALALDVVAEAYRWGKFTIDRRGNRWISSSNSRTTRRCIRR